MEEDSFVNADVAEASHSDGGGPLLVLDVELDEHGHSAKLSVEPGDNPQTLVRNFCNEHSLSARCVRFGWCALCWKLSLLILASVEKLLHKHLENALSTPVNQTPAGSLTPSADPRGRGARVDPLARMHDEAVQHRRAMEHAAAEARALREAALKELEKCTFRPVLTEKAHRLARPEPAWRRLAALAPGVGEIEQARVAAVQEREAAELEKCSFAPVLCARSAALMRHRDDGTQHLYEDAARRAARAAAAAAAPLPGVTFAPSVLPAPPPQQPLVDRLLAAGERASARRAAAAAEDERSDRRTGQLLWTPRINYTAGSEARPCLPVHELLLARGEEAEARKARAGAEDAARRAAAAASALPRSAALCRRRHERRFAAIFEALDAMAGGSGSVDLWAAADAAYGQMNADIAADVAAAAAIAGGGEVDAPTFVVRPNARLFSLRISQVSNPPSHSLHSSASLQELMSVVVEASRTGPRGYLAASFTGHHDDAHSDGGASQTPAMSDTSRALAARRRADGEPIHVSLWRDAEAAEARRRAAVEAQRRKELAECTFRPNTGGARPASRAASSGRATPWAAEGVMAAR